jgi:hypothetical protein
MSDLFETDPTPNIDSKIDLQRFAIERSHKDADASNATARATGQAIILINGGAATAVLAFLSKDHVNVYALQTASICLVGYVVGVLAGVCMLFCSTRYLDYYSYRWRITAGLEPTIDAEKNRKLAFMWWKAMRNYFYFSVLLFVCTSTVLAWTLYNANQ